MLHVTTPFPHVGCEAYMDDTDAQGAPVVEKVRILADKGAGEVLISIRSRRYRHEMASGNRTVPLDSLRETEQPLPPEPKGRAKGRRR